MEHVIEHFYDLFRFQFGAELGETPDIREQDTDLIDLFADKGKTIRLVGKTLGDLRRKLCQQPVLDNGFALKILLKGERMS